MHSHAGAVGTRNLKPLDATLYPIVSRSQIPFGNAFLDAPRRTVYFSQRGALREGIPKRSLGTRTQSLGTRKSIASYSLRLIRNIGKWSMADVFVVALLLTFFIVNKDKSTDAAVQTGLYFFLCYVILSMIASHLLIHAKVR